MKIYLISEEKEAKQVSQLLKLNSECAKLHWSKSIELPSNILSSLESVEAFVEEKVYEVCTEKNMAGSLTDDEEATIMKTIRKTPELRATLGLGVVMAGAEAECVSNLLRGKSVSESLAIALDSGKNVVLF